MSRIDDILSQEETIPTISKDTIMAQIVKNLSNVYDPEMPSVSVIHLGLIYDIEILEENTLVKITHTLTSAFCPFSDEISNNIKQAGMVEGIKECIAHCTFQPPFSMDMVPEDTKLAMGWY
tara:strand:- start:266 stop:628 length:363 start_codon:yes stop_codon:yes gene_type:complete